MATDELATTYPAAVPDGPRSPVTTPNVTTPREDLISVILGALLVGGALTDAWAHTNRLSTLESFFTPWHALLYGGFGATALWTFAVAYRRRALAPRWWRDAWPAGYEIGALGVVIFMASGVGDMIWHTLLGIEAGLDAALSPTHIGITVGATLILTSALRSWWANGSAPDRAVSGIVSLALGTTFGGLLLENASALLSSAPTQVYDHVYLSPSHLAAVLGMSKYLFTTTVIVVPVLLAHRRRATFGTTTAVVGFSALFLMTQVEWPRVPAIAAVGAVAGAAVADLVLVRLDARRGADAPLRLPIAGAVIAACVWSGHLLGLQLADALRWPIELWAGAVVLTSALSAVLGGLAARPLPPVTAAS
jgi:hypothetical protein